jgi:hypothetical protein
MNNNDAIQSEETISGTLSNRTKIYGEYGLGIKLRADIIELILKSYTEQNEGVQMSKFYEGAIFDIVNKLCRLAVTPNHIDSWRDIAGYSLLMEKHLKKSNTGI